MKKYVLIIFASVLFAFEGSAQAQLGSFNFLCDQFNFQTADSIIDNVLVNPSDFNGKTNQIFISKTRYSDYSTLSKIIMFFDLIDINGEPIVVFPINRFKAQITILGEGGGVLRSAQMISLTDRQYIYDLGNTAIQLFKDIRVKVTLTDMNFAISYSPNLFPPYTNAGFPILRRKIIYNPAHKTKYVCQGGNYYGSYDNMDLATETLYIDGQQNLIFQWTSSTGGNFTDIVGATNSNLQVSNVNVKTYYNRKAIFTTSAGVTTTYFSKDTLLTLIPMTCGTFSAAITGSQSITPNQTVTYSVPATVGMQYEWTVIGGTIMSGQGTNTITVLWDGGANLRTSTTNHSVSVKETDATPESKITTQEVTIQTATSINNSFAVAGISVFPNPIKDQFSVVMPQSSTAVSYTVYSTTGINMQSGSFTSSTSGTSIQTSLPAGIYQLVLNYDGVFTSTRLAVY